MLTQDIPQLARRVDVDPLRGMGVGVPPDDSSDGSDPDDDGGDGGATVNAPPVGLAHPTHQPTPAAPDVRDPGTTNAPSAPVAPALAHGRGPSNQKKSKTLY